MWSVRKMSETDFLGRGIDFPFVIDAKGSFGFAEGVNDSFNCARGASISS